MNQSNEELSLESEEKLTQELHTEETEQIEEIEDKKRKTKKKKTTDVKPAVEQICVNCKFLQNDNHQNACPFVAFNSYTLTFTKKYPNGWRVKEEGCSRFEEA